MRKIVIGMSAGMCGTDAWEFYEVSKDLTDDQLGDFAWERGVNHAEMYGIYPRGEYADSEELSEEDLDSDSYSDDIEGYWEDYDPKKHDSHTMTGTPKWDTVYL